MTFHQTIHGRAGSDANNALPEADTGFDLFRLDCIADALCQGPRLTREEQHELRRVIENLAPLLETAQ